MSPDGLAWREPGRPRHGRCVEHPSRQDFSPASGPPRWPHLVHIVRNARRTDKWTIIRSWGPRKLADLAEWRRNIVVLPGDELTATTWGELQARAQARGRPRPINDSGIAASCIAEGIPLATFNTKDYEDFAHHDGLTLFDVS